MTTIGWIILLILLVPALGLLAWVVFTSSLVKVPSGSLALLLVRGRPTDTTLDPGLHFIPALRRRMGVLYPSIEQTYRGGGTPQPTDQDGIDCVGDAAEVWLGDRVRVRVDYTVRFRLQPSRLRSVHQRFGPGGIFPVVRERSVVAFATALGRPGVGIDDLLGECRATTQAAVADEVRRTLDDDGIEVVACYLTAVDLGRTGEVIQAISRAPHELAAEDAGAGTRLAQARHDTELADLGVEPWRYRETDLWRELILRREGLNVALQNSARVADTSMVNDPAAAARAVGPNG